MVDLALAAAPGGISLAAAPVLREFRPLRLLPVFGNVPGKPILHDPSIFLHLTFAAPTFSLFRQKDVMHISSAAVRRRLFHAFFYEIGIQNKNIIKNLWIRMNIGKAKQKITGDLLTVQG